MTISPDAPRDQQVPPPSDEPTRHEESDFSQRPEEEDSQSRLLKILLVIVLIAIGIVAIPVIVTLFSSALQSMTGDETEQSAPIEQQEGQP